MDGEIRFSSITKAMGVAKYHQNTHENAQLNMLAYF